MPDEALGPLSIVHINESGRFFLNFQNVESSLSAVVWQLISRDESMGELITRRLQFGALLELAKDLYKYRLDRGHVPDSTEDLGRLLTMTSELQKMRNKLVHGRWMWGEQPDGKVLLSNARQTGALGHTTEEISGQQLGNAAYKLYRLHLALDEWAAAASRSPPYPAPSL